MRRHFTARALLATCCLAASQAEAATPGLQDVLSAETLLLHGPEVSVARAVLVRNKSWGADLFIYVAGRDGFDPETRMKLLLVRRSIVWSGSMAGQLPTLAVSEHGDLLIKSENASFGRNVWTETLTVSYREKAFVVTKVEWSERDRLEDKEVSCVLDLVTGTGVRNSQPIPVNLKPVPLDAWSDRVLPKECHLAY